MDNFQSIEGFQMWQHSKEFIVDRVKRDLRLNRYKDNNNHRNIL